MRKTGASLVVAIVLVAVGVLAGWRLGHSSPPRHASTASAVDRVTPARHVSDAELREELAKLRKVEEGAAGQRPCDVGNGQGVYVRIWDGGQRGCSEWDRTWSDAAAYWRPLAQPARTEAVCDLGYGRYSVVVDIEPVSGWEASGTAETVCGQLTRAGWGPAHH